MVYEVERAWVCIEEECPFFGRCSYCTKVSFNWGNIKCKLSIKEKNKCMVIVDDKEVNGKIYEKWTEHYSFECKIKEKGFCNRC